MHEPVPCRAPLSLGTLTSEKRTVNDRPFKGDDDFVCGALQVKRVSGAWSLIVGLASFSVSSGR